MSSAKRKAAIRARRNAHSFVIGPYADGTSVRHGRLRKDGTRKIRVLLPA